MIKKPVIAITGGVAMGKSTVAAMFVKAGGFPVSADSIAHDVILRGKPAYEKLVARFGSDILDVRGEIDRRKLGRKAFISKKSRRYLESVTHPLIIKGLKDGIKEGKRKKRFVCLEAPLLFEAKIEKLADKIITVFSSERTQLERLAGKGYSKKEALQRIKAQLPIAQKIKRSDYVIMNEGKRSAAEKQVKVLVNIITGR